MTHQPVSLTARRQCGLSLIELLIGLAVSAVAVGSALPGFKASAERRHLDGVAAQLQTDLHYARSAAVAHQRSLRVSFRQDASGACYVMHSGSAGTCACNADGTPVCTGGALAVRSVRLAATGPVQLSSNVGAMVFDPDKGTVSPTGTVRLTGQAGHAVNVVVNIMGRTRTCTPTAGLLGYRPC
jgi:type IV fimbrial biogenesis protein FimT